MTRYTVEFSVDWVHGWQRAGTNSKTKRHFTQERTRSDMYEIATKYKGESLRRYGRVVSAPRGVPVHVKMDFYKTEPKERPSYLPKWVEGLPFVVKPDVDNSKHILDALNKVAWHDDAQVVTEYKTKHDRTGVRHDRTVVTVVFDLEGE